MSNSITILAKNIRIIDGLYSLNDLHVAAGSEPKHRPSLFMRAAQTQELISEINLSTDSCLAHKTLKGGKTPGTYVCEDLVYAYAMWISAKFSLIVIRTFKAMQKSIPSISDTITDEQAGILYNIVHSRATGNGKLVAEMWGRLKRHFGYSSYLKLKAVHFDEAKRILETMELHCEVKALPAPHLQSYFLRACDGHEFDTRVRSLFDLAGLLAKRGDDIAVVFQKQAREMNQFLEQAR